MEHEVPSPLGIGVELAKHIHQNSRNANYSIPYLHGLIADLTSDNYELSLLLKELVARKAFAELMPLAGTGAGQLRKNVLMQEINKIYLPDISAQISEFLDGFLGLGGGPADLIPQSTGAFGRLPADENLPKVSPDKLLVATDEFGEIQVFDYVVYLTYLSGLCTESELSASRESEAVDLESDCIVKLIRSAPRQPENHLDFQCLYRELVYRIHVLGGAKGIGVKGFRRTLFFECLEMWDDLESGLMEKGMTMMPSQYWKFYQRLVALADGKIQSKYFVFNDPDLEEPVLLSNRAEFWRRFLENLPGDLPRFLLDPRFRREFLGTFLVWMAIVFVWALIVYLFSGDYRAWFWLMIIPVLCWLQLSGYFDF